MGRIASRDDMYRTYLEEYAEKWTEFAYFRREGGILEVRLHHEGGPFRWASEAHRALVPLCEDLRHDPETECIILTGTGDSFIAEFDQERWAKQFVGRPFGPEHAYDAWWVSQTREPFALLDLTVPVICALNGPHTIHFEISLTQDIVICADNCYFGDPHFVGGVVPGDGCQILFRELLGHQRANYFMLTGRRIDAQEALQLGLVSEVLPPDKLLPRAWELAETVFMSVDRIHRRLTRSLLTQPWRELFARELSAGLAHENWACQTHFPARTADDLDDLGHLPDRRDKQP